MTSTVAALLGEAATPTEVRRDAEVLLCHCLGRSRGFLYAWPEHAVDPAVAARFRALLARRRGGEPVAYLTGEREFWSLPLRVTPATLVPRPDTETLVSWALELPLPPHARVLDAGTGSGAIALALAAERQAWSVTAVDRDPAALAVAAANGARLGLSRVRFRVSDWFDGLSGETFDLVVANPPYLAAGDPHLRDGALPHEPAAALVAGATGLEALTELAAAAPTRLAAGGWLLLEHGWEQGKAVRGLLRDAGLETVTWRRDLAGRDRVSGGCLRAQ